MSSNLMGIFAILRRKSRKIMTKIDLLEFLKKNQHRYVSGEDLALHFGVTRAGVCKHIKKLQEEGVKIEGVTNK